MSKSKPMSITTPQFSTIWGLLKRYEIKPTQQLDTDLLCTFCRKLIIDPRIASCGCKFCGNCSRNLSKTDNKKCPNFHSTSKSNSNTSTFNVQIDLETCLKIAHLNVFCPNIGCRFNCKLCFLEEHLIVCNKKDNYVYSLETMTEILESLQKHTFRLMEIEDQHKTEIETLKTDLISRDQELVDMRTVINENQESIQALEEAVNCLLEENENLKRSLNGLSTNSILGANNSFAILKSKPFVWKINHFSEKQLEFEFDSDGSIFSETFYTHENGYKMCLGINPNGANQYFGKYLFMFFCIMKGPFDDNLPWPMKLEVVLSIVDQISLKDFKTFKFKYSKTSEMLQHSFSKPIFDRNEGIGDNEFISFRELHSLNNILRNDSILLRCSINAP